MSKHCRENLSVWAHQSEIKINNGLWEAFSLVKQEFTLNTAVISVASTPSILSEKKYFLGKHIPFLLQIFQLVILDVFIRSYCESPNRVISHEEGFVSETYLSVWTGNWWEEGKKHASTVSEQHYKYKIGQLKITTSWLLKNEPEILLSSLGMPLMKNDLMYTE